MNVTLGIKFRLGAGCQWCPVSVESGAGLGTGRRSALPTPRDQRALPGLFATPEQ
jgi:hypothetical protein